MNTSPHAPAPSNTIGRSSRPFTRRAYPGLRGLVDWVATHGLYLKPVPDVPTRLFQRPGHPVFTAPPGVLVEHIRRACTLDLVNTMITWTANLLADGTDVTIHTAPPPGRLTPCTVRKDVDATLARGGQVYWGIVPDHWGPRRLYAANHYHAPDGNLGSHVTLTPVDQKAREPVTGKLDTVLTTQTPLTSQQHQRLSRWIHIANPVNLVRDATVAIPQGDDDMIRLSLPIPATTPTGSDAPAFVVDVYDPAWCGPHKLYTPTDLPEWMDTFAETVTLTPPDAGWVTETTSNQASYAKRRYRGAERITLAGRPTPTAWAIHT